MRNQASVSERLSHALATPSGAVLELVDELLAVSHEHDLQLVWQVGCYRVRFLDGGAVARVEVPLQKSVIRAVLASGGKSEVAVEADLAKVIRVRFVNTPEEQNLELTSVRPGTMQREGKQSLAATVDKSRLLPRNDVVGR
jgi:hypothetical protein